MKKNKFMNLIENTKKYHDKAQKAQDDLFKYIEEEYPEIDLSDISTNAENADNLEEAISCYCQYGEYSPEKIYEELKQLKK